MTTAAVKTSYVLLEPVDAASVPNGAMFLDINNNNTMTQKSTSGAVAVLATSAGNNPFLKQMVAGEAFAPGKPLSKRADGKVVLADTQDAGRMVLIGYSMGASLADGALVNVFCIGSNLSGILSGLGFTPGQTIFMGEGLGSYTNNISTFTGNNDIYMKVGIADCPAGVASSAATDLIIFSELVSSSV